MWKPVFELIQYPCLLRFSFFIEKPGLIKHVQVMLVTMP